ncbi:MAG: YitT family protein [Rikenellaceae bacterium]
MTIPISLSKKFTLKWFLSWAAVLLGSILVAISIVLFTAPYKIIPGGVYGIGIALNYIFPAFKVGTYGLMMDIPLMLSYFYFFGNNAGMKTVVAAVITPLIMNVMQEYMGTDPATMLGGTFNLIDDKMLCSVVGAAVMGVGLGILFNNGGTSGGTDIIAMFIHRYVKIPLASSLMYVEASVVLFGAIVIGDWKLPLYSLIFIFVCTRVIDYMVGGAGTDKLMFIISSEHQKIKDHILFTLERGGTYIKSTGMYTGQDKDVIFVVVSRNQVTAMRSFVKSVDPLAFMVVVDANETLGDGFKEFE